MELPRRAFENRRLFSNDHPHGEQYFAEKRERAIGLRFNAENRSYGAQLPKPPNDLVLPGAKAHASNGPMSGRRTLTTRWDFGVRGVALARFGTGPVCGS